MGMGQQEGGRRSGLHQGQPRRHDFDGVRPRAQEVDHARSQERARCSSHTTSPACSYDQPRRPASPHCWPSLNDHHPARVVQPVRNAAQPVVSHARRRRAPSAPDRFGRWTACTTAYWRSTHRSTLGIGRHTQAYHGCLARRPPQQAPERTPRQRRRQEEARYQQVHRRDAAVVKETRQDDFSTTPTTPTKPTPPHHYLIDKLSTLAKSMKHVGRDHVGECKIHLDHRNILSLCWKEEAFVVLVMMK